MLDVILILIIFAVIGLIGDAAIDEFARRAAEKSEDKDY